MFHQTFSDVKRTVEFLEKNLSNENPRANIYHRFNKETKQLEAPPFKKVDDLHEIKEGEIGWKFFYTDVNWAIPYAPTSLVIQMNPESSKNYYAIKIELEWEKDKIEEYLSGYQITYKYAEGDLDSYPNWFDGSLGDPDFSSWKEDMVTLIEDIRKALDMKKEDWKRHYNEKGDKGGV